jgi:hypothetical protein
MYWDRKRRGYRRHYRVATGSPGRKRHDTDYGCSGLVDLRQSQFRGSFRCETYHSSCSVGCRIHCLCSRMTSVDYCSFRRRPPQMTEWCRGAVPGVGGWDLTGPDPLQHGGQQTIHSSVAWIISCHPSQDQRTDHIAPLVFILCRSQRRQVGLFQGHGRYPGSARLDHGQETLQHVPGWASFMASVGSALVCKTRLAFSSWVSDRPRLWPDPLER